MMTSSFGNYNQGGCCGNFIQVIHELVNMVHISWCSTMKRGFETCLGGQLHQCKCNYIYYLFNPFCPRWGADFLLRIPAIASPRSNVPETMTFPNNKFNKGQYTLSPLKSPCFIKKVKFFRSTGISKYQTGSYIFLTNK